MYFFRMIRITKYLELGVAHIESNRWEVLWVLERRGYGTVGPSHWVAISLLDRILLGRFSEPSRIGH